MSLTKNQVTRYHTTEQPVRFKMDYLRMDGLSKAGFPELQIRTGFVGRIDGTDGEIETFDAPTIARAEVVADFTAQEKAAGKIFMAACERVAAAKAKQLKDETHDDSDVFA